MLLQRLCKLNSAAQSGLQLVPGGPGATHLINGVYDAAMDNTPFLAILGSRPVNELNMDAFQELNQNPMYNGIASITNV